MFSTDFMSTVWSAAPTPLLPDGSLDIASVHRLADHHDALGVRGVFIGGTCGEGPFLDTKVLRALAEETVKAVNGRGAVAMQITDNSAQRMKENIRRYADAGIDVFVIAPPFMSLNADQEYLYDLYASVVEASPVPVGIYHRGKASSVTVEASTIARLARLPKVVTVKDSASSPDDASVIVAERDRLRAAGKNFFAYNGNEFDCVGAAVAGYDGMTVGGGCFNAGAVASIFQLAKRGEAEEARRQQERLNNLMFTIFGGKNISCWLAGEKQLMVELGIFSHNTCVINYHLTRECALSIHDISKDDINFMLKGK